MDVAFLHICFMIQPPVSSVEVPNHLPCRMQVRLLESPGTADVSAWVDFAALRQAAEESGARVTVHGPVDQGRLLRALGIETRLQQLEANASPQQASRLREGFERITGSGDQGMGVTYKALCISHADLPAPPVGFE